MSKNHKTKVQPVKEADLVRIADILGENSAAAMALTEADKRRQSGE